MSRSDEPVTPVMESKPIIARGSLVDSLPDLFYFTLEFQRPPAWAHRYSSHTTASLALRPWKKSLGTPFCHVSGWHRGCPVSYSTNDSAKITNIITMALTNTVRLMQRCMLPQDGRLDLRVSLISISRAQRNSFHLLSITTSRLVEQLSFIAMSVVAVEGPVLALSAFGSISCGCISGSEKSLEIRMSRHEGCRYETDESIRAGGEVMIGKTLFVSSAMDSL